MQVDKSIHAGLLVNFRKNMHENCRYIEDGHRVIEYYIGTSSPECGLAWEAMRQFGRIVIVKDTTKSSMWDGEPGVD